MKSGIIRKKQIGEYRFELWPCMKALYLLVIYKNNKKIEESAIKAPKKKAVTIFNNIIKTKQD